MNNEISNNNSADILLHRALQIAPKHELDDCYVFPYIYSNDAKFLVAEQQFEQAYRKQTLPAIQMRSPYLNGVIGKIAEDITGILLVESHNWILIGQDIGSYPGGHGVDLLLLSPTDKLYAVEVKGTLNNSRWPRLSKGRLNQMTLEWLNKSDNPLLGDWELSSEDIYGMVIYIHFSKRKLKGAITKDFIHGVPIQSFDNDAL